MFAKRSLIALAATAALLATGAARADNESIATTGATTLFADATPFAGSFIDIKAFTGLADGDYTFTFGFLGVNLNLLGATFDGVAIPTTTINNLVGGALTGTFTVAGAPVLFALAGSTSGAGAAYNGVLNVSLVPEPETYALLLAGLAGIGFMAGRRVTR